MGKDILRSTSLFRYPYFFNTIYGYNKRNMKRIILVIFIIGLHYQLFSQNNNIIQIYYEDTVFMRLNHDKYNIWTVKRKEMKAKNTTGRIEVYYDKEFKSIAIKFDVKKGLFEGAYKEFNKEDKYVSKTCLYDKDYRQGTCRDYLYLFNSDFDWLAKDSVIEEIRYYECHNENGWDVVGKEWDETRTIHISEYEKIVGIIRKEED
jgi:hypothetical protein